MKKMIETLMSFAIVLPFFALVALLLGVVNFLAELFDEMDREASK